jgi:signal transduction histidine kinase
MSLSETFNILRSTLQQRAIQNLTRGETIRATFLAQLTRFFDLLEQALVSGDGAWLDILLYEWAAARTESDLEEGERNVTTLLNQLITLTFKTAREKLPAAEALELMCALTPIFTHGIERVTSFENESRVKYLSNELESQRQRAERLDQSKSNFISVAAHEFKTPLTLVEGYAEMLSDLAVSNPDQIPGLLQGIQTGVYRLRELVNDMIDVSLIDNHLMSLQFQPIWLNRSFNLLKAEFQNTLKNRQLSLEVQPFPGSETPLFADPERIYQALKNLVSNAIKYTPDGGKITIDGRIMPGFIEITITDTGIGIAPENQEAIFEKFGQLGNVSLHSSGKTKFKGGGPGLGLPIARGILQTHGGTLWVESPGYDEAKCPGSTFHLLLPIRTQPGDPKLAKLFGELFQPPEAAELPDEQK